MGTTSPCVVDRVLRADTIVDVSARVVGHVRLSSHLKKRGRTDILKDVLSVRFKLTGLSGVLSGVKSVRTTLFHGQG